MPNKSESPWLDCHDPRTNNRSDLGWLTQYDRRPATESSSSLADLAITAIDILILLLIVKNIFD